ncbi:glycosyltransferase [uncultured Litoreibacter sp.]|uniref:glycosyltransferase n=1 Tax=uncultured Litoreibacter sp. TaxID=1392394 RepID=UPI0026159363|nr:glycosyltransferase [uncultured Litoreibacter sp.]
MQPLSHILNFAPDAPALPKEFSEEVFEMSRSITCARTAQEVYKKLQPILKDYRADQEIAIACGLLLEKQRHEKGMRDIWDDLCKRYPDDLTALRMLMRWYRREGNVAAGVALIADMFQNCWHDLDQANKAIPALAELKAWGEIDEVMSCILRLHSEDRPIRMRYIKLLHEQSRFLDAKNVAKDVHGQSSMGTASQELLGSVSRHANLLDKYGRTDAAEVIFDIIAQADAPRAHSKSEKVVFFTGQLGTGGAERQMTRIACAYQSRFDEAQPLGIAPKVWVKHATASTGADFYRPLLNETGVETSVLAELVDVPLASLEGLSDELKALLELLAPDVLRHTCLLYKMFCEDQTDVAYLWQDGGIVQSAIAAVLAGVPRIITSFRGLPPNLRPNLFREELPVLYAALDRLPHVTFTANSQKAATAYEEWLSLEPGEVIVVPNAIPAVLPDGEDSDHAYWSEVLEASSGCTKTVLGVFRFDQNKRPIQWIKAAARSIKNRDDTRFIMLGGGALHNECQALIEELGLTDRIFLAGIRSKVGFYMHRADLLVHLAEMEGLPNVLIEAQLAGTPVLATPAGGTDEVVFDGITGHILSTATIIPEEELDSTLERLLADEDELAKLGAAAMTQSGDRFSVETILGRTTEIFNSSRQDTT